jgi:hypothetical protein
MQKPTEMDTRSGVLAGLIAALVASSVFVASSAQAATPSCTGIAAQLLTNSDITKATSVVVPASGNNLGYCNVQITVSDMAGPAYGYLAGQAQAINIGIGLPLSSGDGGSGGVQGSWNGRIVDLGGGGFQGSVGSTTSSTNFGYVGSSTDTGHSGASGTFSLNPDDSLNWGQIKDFFYNGIHAQSVWSKKLTLMYYGMPQQYAYWSGGSTGGRQGHQIAQRYPDDYDGIITCCSAFNWDRFIPAEMWGEVVMNQEVGAPISAAKLGAVTNAAIASCQNKFGGAANADGIIQDPRQCLYSANAYVCGLSTATVATLNANGGYSTGAVDTTNCLTVQEASAVNKIWDGPPSSNPQLQSWFGMERGTPLSSGLDGSTPFSISTVWFQYWEFQNPAFDWHTLTEANFIQAFQQSEMMFHQVAGTDDPNLSRFKAHGGKLITMHGLADQLIMPRGTYNYYNRVMAAMGGLAATQSFYRLFPYPGNNHEGGNSTQPNAPLLNFGPAAPNTAGNVFNGLVNWVENGVAPTQVIAYNNTNVAAATVSRPICMYPNTLSYNGSGSVDSAANFTCVTQTADQFANAATVVPDPGPQPVESIADTHDYNADHISDVLWRDTAGDVGMWLVNGNSVLQTAVLGNLSPTTWGIVGQRDFTGQGYSSILWRDTAGDVGMWQMNGTTVQSTTMLSTISLTPSPTNWSVVATGDFNANGTGDILWEDNQGNLLIWFMNGSQISSTQMLGKLPANTSVVGADMNGWIFLRNTVTGDVGIWIVNGGTVAQTVDFGIVPLNWTIAGIGDFNHGGVSDILWRDNLGNVGVWVLQPTAAGGGTVQIASTQLLGNVPLTWSIAQTGDFNGDLRADILWIDNTGNVGAWFLGGSSPSSPSPISVLSTGMYGNVGTIWSVQAMNSE